ncbi:DUF1642 domain-containing protein [Latilactobacillus sakei]|uniref:DUF1642 domain-containing protein n=1 Tax=Latilactobacillus sakei TaxID=1599 RepID=A0AAF0GLT8_LATSK|nr:DUF1642 domain-containing protein [Latilactobacillus sakei]WGI18577.1 DUF1642 domain-containing protein [Latilactobacillus sakei]
MTDVYVATPTQADYDALMRLAEAAGYKWMNGELPTEYDTWKYAEEQTVVHLYDDFQEGKITMRDDRAYYESQNATIETIPNLANIKAIWKVSRENRNAFTMKHLLPPHYKSARKLYVICDEYSGTYATKENEIYEALATEYKLQESEDIMSEKVKLSKRLYDALQDYGVPEDGNESCPVGTISGWREEESGVLGTFIDGGTDNQWLLIDALRYGYEAEPEQLYYVPLIKKYAGGYLNQSRSDKSYIDLSGNGDSKLVKTKFTMPEIIAIDPRYKAFAVPVDEVEADD